MRLTDEQLVQACANLGHDLTCGNCACLFFTGYGGYDCDPTCKTYKDPNRKPLEITFGEEP